MSALKIVGTFAIAAIFSGLAFAAFSYRQAYFALQSTFNAFEARYETERSLLSQRSTLWHAEVVSVDIPGNQLTIAFKNQVFAGKEDVTITIKITETTLFVRQSLIASEGAYIGFSETASGSLSDLSPGMRIAVEFFRKSRAEQAKARVILFGGAT